MIYLIAVVRLRPIMKLALISLSPCAYDSVLQRSTLGINLLGVPRGKLDALGAGMSFLSISKVSILSQPCFGRSETIVFLESAFLAIYKAQNG